jgi:hypothetical protein
MLHISSLLEVVRNPSDATYLDPGEMAHKVYRDDPCWETHKRGIALDNHMNIYEWK